MTSLIKTTHGYELIASQSPVTCYPLLSHGTELSDIIAKELVTPLDIVAGFLFSSLGTSHEPRLGLKKALPRAGRFDDSLSARSLGEALNTSRPEIHALSAGLLQCVDHWSASHEEAQAIETGPAASLGAWWHAIAHRREPDAFNAKYWVRKAGAWPEVANMALIQLIKRDEYEASSRFVVGDKWKPELFFDAIASPKLESGAEHSLKRLQRLEILALLEATWHAVLS